MASPTSHLPNPNITPPGTPMGPPAAKPIAAPMPIFPHIPTSFPSFSNPVLSNAA